MEEKPEGIIIPWMRTLRRGDRPVARPLAVFIQYKSFDRQPVTCIPQQLLFS